MIEPKYYHAKDWECHKNGMYRTAKLPGDNEILNSCIALLKDESEFFKTLVCVINSWNISSSEHLTKTDRNRKAWLGWAACCYKYKAPDFITRKAWGMLYDNERARANDIANKIILMYEDRVNNG